MGQLMKPLRAEPEIMAERVQILQADPVPTVVMISVPGALADKRVLWAAGLVALAVLIVGLSAIFRGDSQAVIGAKQAHIESLERVTGRMAEIAETAVAVDRSGPELSYLRVMDGMATGLTIILIGLAMVLVLIVGSVVR